MSRRSAHNRSTLDRVRGLPWVALAQTGVAIGRRWRALSGKERARLTTLARASRGRPGKLTAKERLELRALLAKLDLRGVAGELLALVRRGRRGRRRARK